MVYNLSVNKITVLKEAVKFRKNGIVYNLLSSSFSPLSYRGGANSGLRRFCVYRATLCGR